MLDHVVEKIILKIQTEVVKPNMDNVPLSYLLTRNIPNSVKHFFDQEVEIWLREETEKFSSSERFDYDMPEVRVLIDKIFDILKQTANFHINKFNQLLERAIKLEANYLVRPQQTLTQFLFKDTNVITTMDVYDMLKYFDKFHYYKDALTDYFNMKYLREINRQQFEELIREIDRQVYSREKLDTALKLIKSIINFLNEGRTAAETIPLEILESAFRDRGLDEFAELVDAEANAGTTDILISDLETLLRTGKTSRQRIFEEKKSAEVKLEDLADIEEVKPEVQVEEISVPKTVAAPAPEVEEEEEDYEDEEVEEVAKITAADQLADVVAEKIKGENLEDLKTLIPRKLHKKFVKKIFKKDETRYQKFIEFLNEIGTWKQASVAIDEMLYQTGINPYSKEALEFSDLIYNRYFPKDRVLNRDEIM